MRQESLWEVVKEEGFMTTFEMCKSLPKVTSFEQGKSSHTERYRFGAAIEVWDQC